MAFESPDGADFNDLTFQIPQWIMPPIYASTGQLSMDEIELLQHYKSYTWRTFDVRGNDTTTAIHIERVPQLSFTQTYLLSALLSLAASHRNSIQPSKRLEDQALMYRQKTFQTYTKALQDITSDNYEPILCTGTFLLALVPKPSDTATDDEYLDWMYTLLKMAEGLRILAGLKWSQGIHKLSIFPLISRELRKLPPPPVVANLRTQPGPLGSTPENPNPPSLYGMPEHMGGAVPVFLPPCLMVLLESIECSKETGPLDVDGNDLYPVFHVLSPIFLSLYYYHLNPDFNVRVFVFSSFLMPEFLTLVKARETRALVLLAWWFALVCLVRKGWWITARVKVVATLGRVVRELGDAQVIAAIEGAERVVQTTLVFGEEMAAEGVFEGWDGVDWADGPKRAEAWEMQQLMEITSDIDFDGLDLNIDLDLNIGVQA